MCELMTIAAALVFTALYFMRRRNGKSSSALFTTMMMFWGAALMWSVDCVHAYLEEGELFDLSRDDALLGALILACAAALFAALRVREVRAAA